ncbi:MAG: MBL fold metallo-hydrolase [Sedimentisphaerales bacterium]|nr:MBL fold metallo-hydrolase [Sedimentisphaerales bacterium]
MIYTCSLQSGSNGNCFYVETPDVKLIFDAGISGRMARQRLEEHERDIRDVDAVIISHNHTDHVKYAGVYNRKYSLPVYITPGSWQVSRSMLGRVHDLNHFQPGDSLRFADTLVETVPTPHDGVDGVAFSVRNGDKRLGIFTDLGHCFDGLNELLSSLDGVYLESNYDPEMLENGPYPPWLKKRIMGDGGHISNEEASQLVCDCAANLKLLVLSHLSQFNNEPEIALNTAQSILGEDFPIAIAQRTHASEMFVL